MTYILYNPFSGNHSAEEEAKVVSALQNDETVVQDIPAIKDYRSFFAQLTEYDTVILCGGDGTLNRFVNDTANIDIRCNLLYYPIGTGNDFAHDLGYSAGSTPFPVKDYIDQLPTVSVNEKEYRFINGVGYGIDGYCCEVGDQLKAASAKKVNYTAIAIKGLLFHFKPRAATVTVDGTSYRYEKVWIAPTMKGRFYGGGMMPTPEQNRRDPEETVSLMVFHDSGKLKTLAIFPSIFKGKHVKHTKFVAIHTGHHISVSFDKPSPLQIDGETILNVRKYEVRTAVYANKNKTAV